MMQKPEWYLEEAARCLDIDSADKSTNRSRAYTELAIAQMMYEGRANRGYSWWDFGQGKSVSAQTTAEPMPEPCQCKAEPDELAAAAPELLLMLVRAAEWRKVGDGMVECPWCEARSSDWHPQHESNCPVAAILRKFKDR